MSPEQIIVHLRHLLSHTDKCGIFVSEYELRSVFDAYEALRLKYRQVMDAARVNEDAPTVCGYDPSGDERTVSLRWPSGNLHCYDRTDMRTVDLMEAEIDELRAKVEGAGEGCGEVSVASGSVIRPIRQPHCC